ncbi:hypothetical protein RB195_015168 [Necator americanus]|uniref:HTH psq-type domain-containing protein n=1 Tax=Necator americanus TaxID=51031 RepID=A0ABR1E5Z1_NECAM
MSLEDSGGRGRLSEVDNHLLKAIINYQLKTAQVAQEQGTDHSTVRYLEEIEKVKKLSKWVPHELSESQRNCRFEICSTFLLRNKSDPLLDRVVMYNEK